MSERRSCPRWQTDWQIKVRFADQESEMCCTLCDINFKGAKICLEQRLAPDARLSLSLCLSSECLLDVEAWVVWHKHTEGAHSHGFYFTKIKEPDKEKLYQFIQKNFKGQINKQVWEGVSIKEEGGEEMEDRRIFERFTVAFPLKFLDLKQSKEGQAKAWDISAKGVCLVTDEEFPPNTPLELWLKIPDKNEPLYTRGNVVWSKTVGLNEYRVGVNLEKAELLGFSRVLRSI